VRTIEVKGKNGDSYTVECFGEFDHEIDGRNFRFAITKDVTGLGVKNVTHKKSGSRVCALIAGASYQPAFAHLASDKARAISSLESLIDKHGAARVRCILAQAEEGIANSTPPGTRDTAGNVVNPQWAHFETTLAAQYRYLFQAFPSEYMPAMQKGSTPESLAKKMTLGLADGSASKDGEGIKRTCKALGIKHTYKAIHAYLTPAGANA
jgi:hypothetical protein